LKEIKNIGGAGPSPLLPQSNLYAEVSPQAVQLSSRPTNLPSEDQFTGLACSILH